MKKKILVLCTGNSARSQIAEGIFQDKGQDGFDVVSAGTNPKGLNPLAVQVMNEIGIDISSHTSKDVSVFEGQSFDYVITVCDHAKESCPVFAGSSKIHWSTPDPSNLDEFRAARDLLFKRIDDFLMALK